MHDNFTIANKKFNSRLIVGTGKYKDFEETANAVKASAANIVTVAVRRVNILDEDQQEEIHDYFMESESDNIKDALKEFDGDYDTEELRLMRIKFISEVAN